MNSILFKFVNYMCHVFTVLYKFDIDRENVIIEFSSLVWY